MSTEQSSSTPAAAPTPVLNFPNIQGDIILGLPKKVEEFVFFQITNVALFRKQIRLVAPLVTTMEQTIKDYDTIKKHKLGGNLDLIKISGTNIAFSQFGLTKMGITESLGDTLFHDGQLKDAAMLGDKGQGSGDNFVPDWEAGFKKPLDGVIILSAECRATLVAHRVAIDALFIGSIKVIVDLFCNVRPGPESGHEHFGFQDGISQPGIKGFTQVVPGQDAVDPGIILLGNGQDTRTSKLAKDGSFLAFRKLDQLVPEFDKFLLDNGARLDMTPQEGADLLGARLVGRWKSGAPIDITPLKDDPILAADPQRNNNFEYAFKNPDDQTDQTRCPFAAHIRKTYPRQDLESKGVNLDPFRIIRQGCPYGPEVSSDEKQEHRTKHERGLAFVAYQGVLSKGFHFLQQTWANAPTFPPKANPDGSQLSPGFDPIIGQNGNGTRSMVGFDPKAQGNSLSLPTEFVVSKGGEYFFIPSIVALKEVIGTA